MLGEQRQGLLIGFLTQRAGLGLGVFKVVVKVVQRPGDAEVVGVLLVQGLQDAVNVVEVVVGFLRVLVKFGGGEVVVVGLQQSQQGGVAGMLGAGVVGVAAGGHDRKSL